MSDRIIKLLLSAVLGVTLCSCGRRSQPVQSAPKEGGRELSTEVPDLSADAAGIPAAEDISGTYYAFSCTDAEGNDLLLEGEILTLESGGTGMFQIGDVTDTLKWSYDGRSLTFLDSEGDVFLGTNHNGLIAGTYFNDYYYMFTSDYQLFRNLTEELETEPEPKTSGQPAAVSAGSGSYYTVQTLYEPTYGIKTANALVPYGWNAWVTAEWGLCSTTYPALATITMTSPDGSAMIEICSAQSFLQLARNGSRVPEGTYLDFYNTVLNYRNAHQYNEFLLEKSGWRGTLMNAEGPTRQLQQELDAAASSYLSALSSSSNAVPVRGEGSHEKTTYFITQGNAYETMISSSVIMAEMQNGMNDSLIWTIPYAAMFTAFTEEGFSRYSQEFDTVVSNSSFSNEFLYVVQRNAQYLNEMMRSYLLKRIYSPGSGEIRGWADEYQETEQDRLVNAWCDVITERDEYVTGDGKSIKVPTSVDSIYQDGDNIYLGPKTEAPQGWTQLEKKNYAN